MASTVDRHADRIVPSEIARTFDLYSVVPPGFDAGSQMNQPVACDAGNIAEFLLSLGDLGSPRSVVISPTSPLPLWRRWGKLSTWFIRADRTFKPGDKEDAVS